MNAFNSKILLFGEYGVISGGKALTMPYDYYQGELTIPRTPQSFDSSKEIKTFFSYLKSSEAFIRYHDFFDFSRFQFEINRGLYFDSNIPQGYGVGSSGALTAAIFSRYVDKAYIEKISLDEIQKCLAVMESHFHGKSSGLDPLVSFYNKPLLYEKGHAHFCELPKGKNQGEFAFFILDTGRSRRTEALVNLYMEKLKVETFKKECEKSFIGKSHLAIEAFLKEDLISFFDNFFQISFFQYHHLTPMIPKIYMKKWKDGLDGADHLLKLCGAGGGGFLLGVTRNFSSLGRVWGDEQIKILWRF